MNSLDDWCIFAPPQPGPDSVIGNTERIEVAWCTADGHGTRLIPDGSITGAHFVQTPDYVQITGVGDLTKINIPAGDEGGELDPHGADGNGEYPETRNARYRSLQGRIRLAEAHGVWRGDLLATPSSRLFWTRARCCQHWHTSAWTFFGILREHPDVNMSVPFGRLFLGAVPDRSRFRMCASCIPAFRSTTVMHMAATARSPSGAVYHLCLG